VSDYLNFGDTVRGAGLGQCQYVSRYVGGRHGSPDLGEGLRIKGDPADYHCLTIHKDDAEIFIQRVLAYRAEQNRIVD
jgi:hypothetical protein